MFTARHHSNNGLEADTWKINILTFKIFSLKIALLTSQQIRRTSTERDIYRRKITRITLN